LLAGIIAVYVAAGACAGLDAITATSAVAPRTRAATVLAMASRILRETVRFLIFLDLSSGVASARVFLSRLPANVGSGAFGRLSGRESSLIAERAKLRPAALRRYELPEMKIITQVLDSTYGKSAVGVRARLSRATGEEWTTVAEAETNAEGCIEDWDSWRLGRGLYRIVFDSDSYFAGLGTASAYPEVIVIFRMQEESHAFQVQVTISPYSYSTYFGKLDGHSDHD
jgi:5-hydroxyisourate hydrolase